MIYLLISILILTVFFWIVNKVRNKAVVCPICAATVVTWISALIGIYLNLFKVNNFLLAILIALSLGAGAEKFASKFGLWWQVLMVLSGVPAIYYLVQGKLTTAIYFLMALLFGTVLLNLQFSAKSSKGYYKDTFKDCCN